MLLSLGDPELSGLGNLPIPDAAGRNYGWDEIIDFDTAIAAGASGSAQTVTLDPAFRFWIGELGMEVFTSAVYDTNVKAGTPVAEVAGNSVAADANEWATRAHFRLQVKVGNLEWFSRPQRLSLVAGTIKTPAYLRPVRIIDGNQSIVATLYNDTADVSVKAQLVLKGLRQRK